MIQCKQQEVLDMEKRQERSRGNISVEGIVSPGSEDLGRGHKLGLLATRQKKKKKKESGKEIQPC